MGRSSKFSFPIPGRKHAAAKEAEAPKPSGRGLSKAQRILGTDNDLNIDAPTRDDNQSWRYASSRSSGMSISISESSQSNENESIHSSQSRQWDRESGVFPKPPSNRIVGRASSTVLGQRFGDDAMTTTSGVSRRLRNEDSSSTLKSYYDRQKLPPAISQQTSDSSARDLALRKGYPSTIPRSHLAEVQTPPDDTYNQYSEKGIKITNGDASRDGERKKPSKLDLSRLFPRHRQHKDKNGEVASGANSTISMSTEGTRTPASPNKLRKAPSKESMQSQKYSVRSGKSYNPESRKTNGTLLQLYDSYEHLPPKPSHMDRIPERGVLNTGPNGNSARAPRTVNDSESYEIGPEKEPFSWKNVRSSMIAPPWETSSAASVSSRNTKTSRRTGSSTMSHSDLKQKSVLSLSSDSESSDDELASPVPTTNSKSSKMTDSSSQRPRVAMHSSSQHPDQQSMRSGGQRDSVHGPFLELPKSTPTNSRLSGPWAPSVVGRYDPHNQQKNKHMSTKKEQNNNPRNSTSTASKRSSQQPTPPLSPSSIEFRQTSERSSRFMAVTKQEEQLLEALRQKRARMREEIIEEHETKKSPPRIPQRSASRISAASSVSTIRGPSDKHRILLYLDTPIAETQAIDTAEPSPDLSDFLSFGSDDESTPRTSWAPSKNSGRPRPDSSVSPRLRGDGFSPMTPPTAPRISAVGSRNGFRPHEPPMHLGNLLEQPKKRLTGVRFADDSKSNQDYLMDSDEQDGVWGM